MAWPVKRPPWGLSWVKARLFVLGFSTTNSDKPRWGGLASASVRASNRITPALPANVHHVLAPFSRQPRSPSCVVGVAFKATDATSEPVLGSVTEMATKGSPAAMAGSQRAFCSSLPPSRTPRAMISGRVIKLPAAPSEPLDNSSVTTTMPRLSSRSSGFRPPYRAGTERPKQPSSRRPSMMASGTIESLRWMSPAIGMTRSSAKRRNVSRIKA